MQSQSKLGRRPESFDKMTTYLSSLSGHVATLKRLIPTSLSPESDLSVNDPEDSHVSRVLRAYYTEKGRPFPQWLGPDPRAPQQAAPVFASTMPSRNDGPSPAAASMRSGRGLGDLFGDNTSTPPPAQESMSLRQPRRQIGARSPAPVSTHSYQEAPSARPLPSQRAGSYQTRPTGVPPGNASLAPENDLRRAPSAQDRLKARFGGGGRAGSAMSDRSASPNYGGGNDGGAGRRW